MRTYSSHHPGIDRVVQGLLILKAKLDGISLARFLPAAMLTGSVTAILVGASHLLADLFDDGALTEWLLMWGIALVAVWVLAGYARTASTSLLRTGARLTRRFAERDGEARFIELARQDPRVAADLRAAQLYAERQAEERGA